LCDDAATMQLHTWCIGGLGAILVAMLIFRPPLHVNVTLHIPRSTPVIANTSISEPDDDDATNTEPVGTA